MPLVLFLRFAFLKGYGYPMYPDPPFRDEVISPLRKTETDAEMRLEWDNFAVRKDRLLFWCLLGFGIVWVSMTVFVTAAVFAPLGPRDLLAVRIGVGVWTIAAWLGAIIVVYTFSSCCWCEWIAVSGKGLSWGADGWLAPRPKSVLLSSVVEVKIGRYEYPADPDSRELVMTLNIFCLAQKGRTKRHSVAYWLHPKLKEELFVDMKAYCQRRGIPLAFDRY